MTREEVKEDIIKLNNTHLLCILPTGYGKTKIALEYTAKYNPVKILIVIPYNTLIKNWEDEIKKWNFNFTPVYSTYRSIDKHLDVDWDVVIFDECHHITERVAEIVHYLNTKRSVMLSATVSKEVLFRIKDIYSDLKEYKVKMREAIDNKVLPDPTIILLKLQLSDSKMTSFTIHPKAKGPLVQGNLKNYFKYNTLYKNNPVQINCTQKKYIEWLDNQIYYYKFKFFKDKQEYIKNKWLQLCNQRLKALSTFKEELIKEQLETTLNSYRTLTFCSSIKQTEFISKNCLHSNHDKEKNDEILKKFNSKKINHITSCAMLDEGQNLVDCQLGIYVNISASDRLIIQRLGRLLRHENPYIYIPYFEGTRETEIVSKMLENYNKNKILNYELFELQKSLKGNSITRE